MTADVGAGLGAVHDTVACCAPPVVAPMVGAPGTVTLFGVIAFDAPLAALVPLTFVAVTVQV